MSAIGTTLQESLINYALGNEAYTPPSSYWLALFTDVFNETTNPLIESYDIDFECDATSYVRQEIVNDTSSFAGSGGARYINVTVQFPTATDVSGFGLIKAVALMTDETSTTGDKVSFYGNVTTPKLVGISDTVTFLAGDLFFYIN